MKIRAVLNAAIGLCCLFLVSCQAAPPQGTQVRVSRVVSGQVVEVLDPSPATAQTQPIRLLGLGAPPAQQDPWGKAAQARLAELAIGQTLLLETDRVAQDEQGRRLAYLWQGDRLLNETLVAEGYAIAASQVPNTKYEQRLAAAQAQARLLELGIWNPVNPLRQPPAPSP